MTRWFRFYDDALNDPKVQRLSGDKFKAWVNLLCLASKHEGVLPSLADIAFCLRLSDDETSDLLDEFYRLGLFDEVEQSEAAMSYEPHNWRKRQFKSDVSTERVKRFRNAKQTVSETPPETEQRTDTEQIINSEPNGSGADAPDPRKRLFGEGLAMLAEITGKGPDACRSFVGKCLKECEDDAVTVLGLIAEAKRNAVVDPAAWIRARLKPAHGPPQTRANTIAQQQRRDSQEALNAIRANLVPGSDESRRADHIRLSADNGDGPEGVRGGAGATVVLLPASGR